MTHEYSEKVIQANSVLAMAREIGNRRAEAEALTTLGEIYSEASDEFAGDANRDASITERSRALECYQQARTIALELKDSALEIDQLVNIGHAYSRMNNIDRSFYSQALARAQETTDYRREHNILSIIGDNHRFARNYESALHYANQALDVARKLEDQQLVSENLAFIGYTYLEKHDYVHAVPYLEECLSTVEFLNSNDLHVALLSSLAEAYHHFGEYAKAIVHYKEAVELIRKSTSLDSFIALKDCLYNLGRAYLSLGNSEESVQCFEEILQMIRSRGDIKAELSQLQLIVLCFSFSHYKLAMDYAEQGLKLAKQIGEGDVLNMLASIEIVYSRLGNREQTLNTAMKILMLCRETHNEQFEYQTLMRIAGIYKEQGNLQEYVQYYKQACHLPSKKDDPFNLVALARISEDENDIKSALDYCQQALEIFVGLHHKDWIQSVRQKIDELQLKNSNY